ncbi:MAG: 4-hydroxyphenylpyruvate dioxygenase [Actinomycetota bacterium]
MEAATGTRTTPAPARVDDVFPLLGIDHVELYVGNAAQAAYYYEHAFGFRRVATRGLETGTRDRVSHVLRQGDVRLVVTSGLRPDDPIARHVALHGDGVKVIALAVPDASRAYRDAVTRGARAVSEPWTERDDHGEVRLSAIATYGEVQHLFVERGAYAGPFLPGYARLDAAPDPGLLTGVDHVVGNVELGRMEEWVGFYERVMGFTEMIHFTDEDISTEYSALMSKVVATGDGRIKFPINEPAEGARRSQIEEYLEYNGGPGVQHVAFSTPDIVATVRKLRARGVRFLGTPATYYDELPGRVGAIDESVDDLRALGILADRDDEGYLLQIFTEPVGQRPTLFFEIIERHGSRGFGEGNFKALFEAIEREQARRGNL